MRNRKRKIPPEIEMLPSSAAGSYVLEFRIEQTINLETGIHGKLSLEPAWYYYTGSALNGLRSRLSRHFLGTGKMHWHIDRLTRKVAPWRVFYIVSNEKLESRFARMLTAALDIAVPKFGSGDSREAASHLFISENPVNISKLLSEFGEVRYAEGSLPGGSE